MNAHDEDGMSLIVKTVARLTVGLILLYGIHLVVHGHLTPGGGFSGGVVVALSFVNLTLAYGRKAAVRTFSESAIGAMESFGGLLFTGIALTGLGAGVFFLNLLPKGTPFDIFSAGTVPLCNIAIFLKVGAGLFGVFLALALVEAGRSKSP